MKIAMWDTESTDLTASWGRLLCSSIKPLNEDPYTFSVYDVQFKENDPLDQKKFVKAVRDELSKYHMIVTWNGKGHDLSLLNAFLLKYGLKKCAPQFHLDLMWFAGQFHLKIGSKKLQNVQKFFGHDDKTPLDGDTWKRAALGDKQAMKYVVEHCEADVEVLEKVYWKMLPMVANIHR